MAGAFVLVVGPSGAGKDTLIALARTALAEDARVMFPRRVVTRAANAFEDHASISLAEFEAIEAAGGFALAWRAHGLAYGIPGETRRAVAEGGVVVCNVSRTVTAAARAQLARVHVVEVTAPPEILAARIAGRGRDGGAAVAERVARGPAIAVADADLVVVNDRTPEAAAAELVDFLRRIAG